MKKIYLLIPAMGIMMAGYAQRVQNAGNFEFGIPMEAEATRPEVIHNPNEGNRAIIWSENFSNGFAGNNGSTPSTWTTAGTDGAIWDYVNSISAGCYSTGAGTPGFTSVADGFMIFHGDSANCPLPASPTAWDGSLVSPSIDLSSATSVNLTFQHYFRYCCTSAGQFRVSVSNNGTTWTDYDTKGSVAVNASSANPVTTSINISAVAAGQSNVIIRFTWTGGHSHYFWAIDDVTIETSPDHELEFVSAKGGVQEPIWGEFVNYTRMPFCQAQDVIFAGKITNQGANAENNVSFNVNISDGASTVFTGTGVGAGTLAIGDTLSDTTSVAFFPPAMVASYTASYSFNYTNASLDFNTANNTPASTAFSMTTDEIGRDRNVASTGYVWNGDDGGTPAAGNAYTIGSEYVIASNQQLNSVKVALANSSVANTIIYPIIIEVDMMAADFQSLFTNVIYDGTQVAGGEYTVTAGDISSGSAITWINLPLQTPVTLLAGSTYVIGVGTLGGEFCRVMSAGVTPPDATVFLYDATGYNNGNIQWFWTAVTPMIRGVFQPCPVGTEEFTASEFLMGQSFPNPTTGDARIDYSLGSDASVSFELVDVTGKVVMRNELGNKAAGAYIHNINVSELSNGMYYYSIIADGNRLTKRMMIAK
jgi:hypothetical protein